MNYKIVSKSVYTPPSPYYIGVHIHVFVIVREERSLMPQKLETVLKNVEETSNDVKAVDKRLMDSNKY